MLTLRERILALFKRYERIALAASKGVTLVGGYEHPDEAIVKIVAKRARVSAASVRRCELTNTQWKRVTAAVDAIIKEDREPPPSGVWRRAVGLCPPVQIDPKS